MSHDNCLLQIKLGPVRCFIRSPLYHYLPHTTRTESVTEYVTDWIGSLRQSSSKMMNHFGIKGFSPNDNLGLEFFLLRITSCAFFSLRL